LHFTVTEPARINKYSKLVVKTNKWIIWDVKVGGVLFAHLL